MEELLKASIETAVQIKAIKPLELERGTRRYDGAGDALHALSCAVGYNIRWLMRAIVRLGIGVVFLHLLLAALMTPMARLSSVKSSHASPLAAWARSAAGRLTWSAPPAAFAAA